MHSQLNNKIWLIYPRSVKSIHAFFFLQMRKASATDRNIYRLIYFIRLSHIFKLDYKLMPPPKYAPIKKRKSRRPQDFGSSQEQQQTISQPTTPLLQGKVSRPSRTVHRRPTSTTSVNSVNTSNNVQQNDSDSDTACGFDSAWRGSAQL